MAKMSLDKTWRQEGEERVLKAAGTHAVRTYTNRIHATMAQWVDLQPIFKV